MTWEKRGWTVAEMQNHLKPWLNSLRPDLIPINETEHYEQGWMGTGGWLGKHVWKQWSNPNQVVHVVRKKSELFSHQVQWDDPLPRVQHVWLNAWDMSLAHSPAQSLKVNFPLLKKSLEWAIRCDAVITFTSSLSVWAASEKSTFEAYEYDDLNSANRVWGGYAISKWMAESWLQKAGVPFQVVRPGLLTFDGAIFPPHDPFLDTYRAWPSLKSEQRFGLNDERTDWSPTDQVALGISNILKNPLSGRIVQCASPKGVLLKDWAYALEQLGPCHAEKEELKRARRHLKRVFVPVNELERRQDMAQANDWHFDTSEWKKATGITWSSPSIEDIIHHCRTQK